MPAVQGFLLHPPWPLIPFLIQPLGFSPSPLDHRPGARFLPTLNAPQARPCPHPPPRSRVPRRSVADLLWRRARRHDWHRSDNPTDGDQWTWHCGFYPGSNPGDATNGTAINFDAARAAFESAWSVFLSKRTGADFLEYRRYRASDAWKRAMWDPGCKLPTQVADGRSRCFCGTEIGIANMDQHINAAHLEMR